MATTSTLGTIISQVVEELGIGFVIPSYTGTTTTLTLTSSYLAGPFSGSRFPIGTPIIVTSTTGLGEMTYVSNYVPSTGVITVSPSITTGSTDAVALQPDVIDHPDRLAEAVNRAVQNRLMRWQRTPLTFVPDGDLRGATVTDYWTGSNATPTYVTPTYPAGSAAAAFGFTTQRVLQSVTSNASNYVRSNLIDLALGAPSPWYFQTAIRVVSGSGDAEVVIYDETNAANITPSYEAGTGTTTSLGFVVQKGTFAVPATCKQISFRLVSSATTTTIQMTPLVAFPSDARAFPLPNRIISEDVIGNFRYGTVLSTPAGPHSIAYTEPITTLGKTHHLDENGDHMTVTFNFVPYGPVYFDELAVDPSLTLLSSATTFALDRAVKWAKFELVKYLFYSEPQRVRDTRYGSVPVPSRWLQRASMLEKEARTSRYEPETLTVVGRV